MTHHTRRRAGGDGWLNIMPEDLAYLGAGLASCLNGVDGGAWAPSSQLIIAGTQGLKCSGPVVVARGGQMKSGAASLWALSSGAYPTFSPPRSRRVQQPMLGARPLPSYGWRARWSDGAMQSVSPTFDASDGNGVVPARLWLPLRCHDGATLTSVLVNGRVGWPHTTLPTSMPKARVVAVPLSTGLPVPLTSTAAGADANGYVQLAKPTDTSWSAVGTVFTLTLPCDGVTKLPSGGPSNVIDLSQNAYYLEVVEEQGQTGYPWSLVYKAPVKYATTGSIVLSGLVSVDGFTPAAGDRVLVKDQGGSANANGIYLAAAGAWSRAPDLSASGDFTQGMIVPVTSGTTNLGSFWQAASSQTAWGGASATTGLLTFVSRSDVDLETPALAASHLFAHGNVWQSATLVYAGISSQRFQ